MTGCPDDDLLVRLAHGGVAGDELLAVEAHLDGCSDCRALVAAVAAGSAEADPRPSSPLLHAGDRLGRYEVERLIGAGGMGVLYLALDPTLGRRVAVKLMRPHLADERGRARLLREAQAMAQLSHPNVVNVFDLGEVDERVFVAMEYVEGGTLGDWLRTPRTAEAIGAVFRQAGEGLLAAHRAGLVHRDFKPGNVLVGADGRARVTDFGLSRPGEAEPGERPLAGAPVDLTQTGTVLGTPAYMSPEQLELRPADARSDQYGFCVALYEALTGARPFEGSTLAQVRAKVLAGKVPRPPAGRVPERLWRALERGLSVDPARRFPSMEGVLEALRPEAPRPRWGRLALSAVALVAVAGAVAGLTMEGAPPAPRPDATDAPSSRERSGAGGAVPAPARDLWRQEELYEPAEPEPLPPDGAELALEPGSTRGFDVAGAMRVVIANPAVADVVVEQTVLTLGGKSLGRTTLSIAAAGRTRTWPVRVRTAVEAPSQSLALFSGALQLVDAPGLTRVAVGDPSVVDLKSAGLGQLLLSAKKPGRTNVLVWTRDARRLEYVVTVSNDEPRPPATEPVLALEPGLQRALTFAGLERFEVGSPEVCEVQQLGEHELLLLPRAPGRTTLMVWTAGGRHERRTIVVRPTR